MRSATSRRSGKQSRAYKRELLGSFGSEFLGVDLISLGSVFDVDEAVEFPLEGRLGDLTGGVLVFEFLEGRALGLVGRLEASELPPAPADPAAEAAEDQRGHAAEDGRRDVVGEPHEPHERDEVDAEDDYHAEHEVRHEPFVWVDWHPVCGFASPSYDSSGVTKLSGRVSIRRSDGTEAIRSLPW